jgi:hypothetical protein
MTSIRVAVIGAGPSGIAAAKNCIAAGLDVVVFEANDRVGGNWVFDATTGHSSVYENTHIISSRAWSEYEDYPFPPATPEYPHHSQLAAYFEGYARHFGVLPAVRFGHRVTHVEPQAPDQWRVDFTDAQGAAQTEHFSHVMVANGHHWKPKWPQYPGEFTGRLMHSHDFKRVDDGWRGKNVLVIGAGNSACDVAVEAARVAGTVCMSMRSPQWFVPKFLFGLPADVLAARNGWLPLGLRQRLFAALLRLVQGRYADIGLPANTELPMTHHPTINSDLIDFVRHGRVRPRPAVERLDGDGVVFADGRREAFDIIVACTGFWISFPFFDPAFIDYSQSPRVPLWRRMMHPQHRNLYFIGLFQPLGCIWPLAELQARLACAEITGRYTRPADMDAAIANEVARPHLRFAPGLRHSTQVDYHAFRRELREELRKAGIDVGPAPALRRGPRPATPAAAQPAARSG